MKTGVVVYGEDQRIYLNNIEAQDDPRFGEVRAFRTLIDAQNYSCTNGGRKVIIAKVGVWATNYRPNGPANIPGGQPGEIPLNSVDGELYTSTTPPQLLRIFNYVTLVAQKWVHMNMSLRDANFKNTVQAGDIDDKPPIAPSGKQIMFVVRCLPPGN